MPRRNMTRSGMKMYMRPVAVQVQASCDEREQAEQKAYGKTDEIEVRPGHVRLRGFSSTDAARATRPFDRLRAGSRDGRRGDSATPSGVRASYRRSARPGGFRISPTSKTQPREFFSRASLVSTSLTSLS